MKVDKKHSASWAFATRGFGPRWGSAYSPPVINSPTFKHLSRSMKEESRETLKTETYGAIQFLYATNKFCTNMYIYTLLCTIVRVRQILHNILFRH